VAVADSTAAALAMKRESWTTPIVFIQAGNPVGSGLVANLARPGGNLTGFTNYVPSMGGKWLELLKEVAPGLARVAALFNPKTHTGQYWDVLEAATQSLGVIFGKAAVEDDGGIARAVEAMAGEPAGGLIVMPDSFTMSHRETIVALAARHRVPTVYPYQVFPARGGLLSCGRSGVGVYRNNEFVVAGGLTSYEKSLTKKSRQAGLSAARILKGKNPADLPVIQATKFELIINLKTAKAL